MLIWNFGSWIRNSKSLDMNVCLNEIYLLTKDDFRFHILDVPDKNIVVTTSPLTNQVLFTGILPLCS